MIWAPTQVSKQSKLGQYYFSWVLEGGGGLCLALSEIYQTDVVKLFFFSALFFQSSVLDCMNIQVKILFSHEIPFQLK